MNHARPRWMGTFSLLPWLLGMAVLAACTSPAPAAPTAAPTAAPKPAATTAPAPAATSAPAAAAPAAASPAAQAAAAASAVPNAASGARTEAQALAILQRYTPPATPPKLSQTTVKAASVSTSWTVRMATLVAKEKDYWTQEGLTNVDLTVVGPAPTHMAAMIGGSFDFSINLTTDTLARSNAQGEKVYAVAGSSNAPTYSLFGKGVNSVADLKGKVIATDAPGGTGELQTLDILNKYGLSKSDVSLVPVAGTIEEREQAMLNGVAAGALGSGSDLPRLKDSGVVELAKMSEVYPDYQTAVTAGRGAFMDEHPDTSVAFLKGLIRGFAYLQDPAHTDEIMQILKKNDVAVDEKHWADTLALQRPMMTYDGSINVKGTDVVLVREREAGRVPADYTAQKLIRTDALEKAQKELGL